MTQKLWKLFPRLIEQKINTLLFEAEPRPTKAYQLFKSCKNEQLWKNSYALFSIHLTDFFSLPINERAKSYFDKFLDRPMDRALYDSFNLNFRTAEVKVESLLGVARWSNQMFRDAGFIESPVSSVSVLTKTLETITNPPAYEKDHDIEFEDFCITWKKTVFKLFGKEHDRELETILREIRKLNIQLKNLEIERKLNFRPSIYLTQTEIEWTETVQMAIQNNSPLPKYPLIRGPEKEKLVFLQKTIRLYQIVQKSPKPELQQHLESIRNTILEQCKWLLNECSR